MRHRFDQFELDSEQFVLRENGTQVHIEPLVFDLLGFFVRNVGKVVTRDEIIEEVWQGRAVSDATVSSCIKSVRKALGDDGQRQHYVRTVRGRGFQFVASVAAEMEAPARTAMEVSPVTSATVERDGAAGERAHSSPPRIAVLPLFPLSRDPEHELLGDALSQEVILELSRLHWLFVIARGSSFKVRGQAVDLVEAGRRLGATYLLTGTIAKHDDAFVIAVELCHAPDSNVVWAERFTSPAADLMHMRTALAAEIAGALEPRIQLAEAMQAGRVPTEQLDAWAAYHRGLWHMYRFNRRDNELAAGMFTQSVQLDPRFARAHAGLSFTHFQNAFLAFSDDVAGETRAARELAEKSMELDPLDPFTNLTMGRAEWLAGDLESSLPWMERSISLSPNFAFAIYNSALVGTMLGDGDSTQLRIDRAISLSPIDPLNYAMLATRALTHVVQGDFAAAAKWADRAIRSPGAHVHIYTIAAFANEIVGEGSVARSHAATIQRLQPGYDSSEFFRAFPFRNSDARVQVEQALQRLDL